MGKRIFTRVNYMAGASVSYGNQVAICTTGNLSLCGLFLKTGYEIPVNTPVQVTVYDSDLSSFKVTANVVRKDSNGVGLRISMMSVDSFVHLREIVSAHSNDHGVILQETYKMLKCIC